MELTRSKGVATSVAGRSLTGRPLAQPLYLVLDGPVHAQAPTSKAAAALLQCLYDETQLRGGEAKAAPLAVIGTAHEPGHLVPPPARERRPGVRAGNATDFPAALRELRHCIEHDVPALQASGFDVLRPLVVCMAGEGLRSTAGAFAGSAFAWRQARERLGVRQFRYGPHVVVFGFPGASLDEVQLLANVQAFMAGGVGSQVSGVRRWGLRLASEVVDLVGYAVKHELDLPPAPVGFFEVRPAGAVAIRVRGRWPSVSSVRD